MKRFMRILAIVMVIGVLSALLVGCIPQKALPSAKTAWAACAKKNLGGATSIELTEAEYKAFEFSSANNSYSGYAFRFVCSYTTDAGKKSATLYYNCNNGTAISSSEKSYNNLQSNKSVKVTKDGKLSKSQLKTLMAYYNEVKDLPDPSTEEEGNIEGNEE